jgi:hypothetical protein
MNASEIVIEKKQRNHVKVVLAVVPFDFHWSRTVLLDALDSIMEKRTLRIVKKSPLPAIAVCGRCNAQFKSHLSNIAEIKALFAVHQCKPVDSSQNVLRIVREPTEGKQHAMFLCFPFATASNRCTEPD